MSASAPADELRLALDAIAADAGPLAAPADAAAERPRWIAVLEDALRFVRAQASTAHDESLLDPDHPLPFEPLLVPFVLWVRHALAARVAASPLTAAAARALERSLLQRVTALCAPALLAEFDARRPSGRGRLTVFLQREQRAGTRPRDRYDDFVAEHRASGLLPFLARRPRLARLLAQALDGACGATAELVDRIEHDLPLLPALFGWSAAPGPVAGITTGLSDPHHDGRCVAVLTFASGAKLVYKPRSLAADAAFGALLAWCDDGFRVPRTADRGAYGWAEFIAAEPCADEAAVSRFYARAGMLLCVLYLLGTTDCHAENLIACGEQLVLVDAETALQPQVRDERFVPHAAWSSVLRSGFLPHWNQDGSGGAFDMTALGAFAELQTPVRVPNWKHVNTDDMALGDEPGPPALPRSMPVLDGAAVPPQPYAGALLAGFARMYRIIAGRRDALLERGAEHEALRDLAAARVRFVPRATRDYAAVLWTSVQPEHVRSGLACGALLDELVRRGAPAALAALHPGELRALERMDVPRFTVAAAGTRVDSGDGAQLDVPQLFPGFATVLERLRGWDERDLREQLTIARGALEARVARTTGDAVLHPPAAVPREPDAVAHDGARFAVDAARRIAESLASTSALGDDGAARWFGLRYLAAADRYALETLGLDLYDGASGIALFLATLDAVSGERHYRDLALAALGPLRGGLSDALVASAGIGGASGLGSWVYALTRSAALLDEPALRADARRIALRIDDAAIARDRELDVIAGAAGAILCLLALHRDAPDDEVLARAVAAGEHLLRERSGEPGRRAWCIRTERALTGFAHGAAGIALALQRLYAVTGNVAFRDAAREAIAYERSVFSPAARNWPDFRHRSDDAASPAYATMWCHGAPGIGLARLGGLPVEDDVHVRGEIELALATTAASALRDRDHLCCGNLGRAELLLEAALRLNRAPLRDDAARLARAVVARAGPDDAYTLGFDTAPAFLKPSLFRGKAGIGYELLRIAFPDTVPSVLLWN
jgi:type 2 lantibiotic biosynthesis protein LanM